jgi:hypothetical protein
MSEIAWLRQLSRSPSLNGAKVSLTLCAGGLGFPCLPWRDWHDEVIANGVEEAVASGRLGAGIHHIASADGYPNSIVASSQDLLQIDKAEMQECFLALDQLKMLMSELELLRLDRS